MSSKLAIIDKHLQKFEMYDKPGLIPVSKDAVQTLVGYERLLGDQALAYAANYVYVRLFSDGRPPLPQVYIYDNTDHHLSNDDLKQLHKKLWNRGNVPLLYVFSQTEVAIFSCVRRADFLSSMGELIYNPWETLEIASLAQETLERFSGKTIDAGMLWEKKENHSLINTREAAHQALVSEIKLFDEKLCKETPEKHSLGRRLLILCFLVKYLEDRNVFPADYIGGFGNFSKNEIHHFFELLEKPQALIALFDDLVNHFNGDVFYLSQEEKNGIDENFLEKFIQIIRGDEENGQRLFWKRYSFEDIPVELISYIYQNFVKSKEAVYTPSFLVELLINETLSLKESSLYDDTLRILDPACGSGIFLVGAYKRIVSFWRNQHKWKKPSIDILKSILKKNIWGSDIDPLAVELTTFSLNLALCDLLDPKVIWSELKFEKLKGTNIQIKDFFETDFKNFSLIIGNPPFESKLQTLAARNVDVAYQESEGKKRGKLPDSNSAYLFLEHSMSLLAKGGKLCMILPYGILYNNLTAKYRKFLFEKFFIEEVLDFISISNLFEKANVKVCALLIHNIQSKINPITTHVTFRKTKTVAEQLYFEIDHYDVHHIPQTLAASSRFVWRANLLGGYRIFEITDRISQMRSLKSYIDEKKWRCREGFMIGSNGEPCDFITGKPFLPTEAFTSKGIDTDKIYNWSENSFHRPRTKECFTPPMLLIKEHGEFPVAFCNTYLTFKDSIISITGGTADELKQVYDRLKAQRQYYKFFLLLLGSEALTARATSVVKTDIEILPYPQDLEDLKLSDFEEILRQDTMNYMVSFVLKGNCSPVAKESPSISELEAFGDTYCNLLKSLYSPVGKLPPVQIGEIICYPFYLGKTPKLEIPFGALEQHLNHLIVKKYGQSLQVIRMVRLYEGNMIYLIKPNRLRYWLRSTALQDADETLVDLHKQMEGK